MTPRPERGKERLRGKWTILSPTASHTVSLDETQRPLHTRPSNWLACEQCTAVGYEVIHMESQYGRSTAERGDNNDAEWVQMGTWLGWLKDTPDDLPGLLSY